MGEWPQEDRELPPIIITPTVTRLNGQPTIKLYMNSDPDKIPPAVCEMLAMNFLASSGKRIGMDRTLERVTEYLSRRKSYKNEEERQIGVMVETSFAELQEGFVDKDENLL